ncbi:MAG: RNase H-fold protein (predicted Holliday junction resolvase) [Flammeovirgaceae bacterium]|jgi:RNase H-fold protein (predicted Holliday junction resolvase)
MKKTFLLIALLFGLALSSAAQDQTQREERSAETLTDRMKTQLELTDDQYKSVYVANEEMLSKFEEAGGKEADKETKNKIRKEHLANLNEILTPEQMGKMKDGKKQRGAQKRQTEIEK